MLGNTENFADFLVLGFEHITDFEAYDHLLFLVALSATYGWRDRKTLGLLATAFTIGHSLTLILGGLSLIVFRTDWIEFLIPLTIVFTAVGNLLGSGNKAFQMKFLMCACFGTIHGMGFSSFVRMFARGDEMIKSLFAFNLGVEVGQLAILLAIILLQGLFCGILKLPVKIWCFGVSFLTVLGGTFIMIQNWPF